MDYNKVPDIGKFYEDWTVIGEPLPYLSKSWGKYSRYQTKWKVPCECSCGRRDLVCIHNLRRGRSTCCVVCGGKKPRPNSGRRGRLREAFGEKKTIKEWVKDDRCMCSESYIHKRMADGLSLEEAMARPIKWNSKLTPEQIREVYTRANSGDRGIDLSEEFGISSATVSHIKTGKMHAHITQ